MATLSMSIYSEPQYPVKVRVYSSAVHPLIVLLKEAEPVVFGAVGTGEGEGTANFCGSRNSFNS